MRNVLCGVKQTADALSILPDERCSLLPPLNKIQKCSIKPCYTQWITLSWQPVSSIAQWKNQPTRASFNRALELSLPKQT